MVLSTGFTVYLYIKSCGSKKDVILDLSIKDAQGTVICQNIFHFYELNESYLLMVKNASDGGQLVPYLEWTFSFVGWISF